MANVLSGALRLISIVRGIQNDVIDSDESLLIRMFLCVCSDGVIANPQMCENMFRIDSWYHNIPGPNSRLLRIKIIAKIILARK